MFKGFKGGPFKHTETFFSTKCFNFFFFFTIYENAFSTNLIFLHEKYAHNKKERHFLPQGLQIAAFQQSFS